MQMTGNQSSKETSRIPIEIFAKLPFLRILCYPRLDESEGRKRIVELRKLKVRYVEFVGSKEVSGIRVLGKGCVGVVVVAIVDDKKVAMKIRRTDADRPDLMREAEMLKRANAVGVGPEFLWASGNFLLTELVDGWLFRDWILVERNEVKVRQVLHSLMDQCYRLDAIGLDHGELSDASKHIIMGKKSDVFIVDFETASVKRRPSNVTAMAQFLFLSDLSAITFKDNSSACVALLEALRRYKRDRNAENFHAVVDACGL